VLRSGTLALAIPATALAQAADTSHAASRDTTPSVHHVQPALSGLTISGYGEGSYSYSTHPAGRVIVGRLYDRYHDQFELNALKIALDRPYATNKLDAGIHVDALFGQNATVVRSTGLSLGDQGDLTQLYVTLNIPTPNGSGVQLKVGKIATLMGLEVLDDVANPNWSEGNQFIFVENFTALGLSVEYTFNRYVDTQLRLINGWDVVQDNNQGKSFMGRLGLHPDTTSVIGIVGYYGPEEPNSSAKRYGVDVLLSRKLGHRATAWLQGDYGTEQANAALPLPTRAAHWWALGAWLAYDFSSKVGLALRGDYLDDAQGARTSGAFAFPAETGQKVGSGTATLNLRIWPNTLARPELRYDRSSLRVFGGHADQVTFALSLAYIY
jgi:hypothetical protein